MLVTLTTVFVFMVKVVPAIAALSSCFVFFLLYIPGVLGAPSTAVEKAQRERASVCCISVEVSPVSHFILFLGDISHVVHWIFLMDSVHSGV